MQDLSWKQTPEDTIMRVFIKKMKKLNINRLHGQIGKINLTNIQRHYLHIQNSIHSSVRDFCSGNYTVNQVNHNVRRYLERYER